MSADVRAAIVVTGSELVRGDRRDRNGPFLAAELVRLGIEPERVTIVGDREDELSAALVEGLEADLCLVSGGLGPTHDDRTIELLARAAGVELRVDDALVAEIETVSRTLAERIGRPYADFAAGVVKQATLPAGGLALGLAGTAPGVVLDTGGCVAVSLPGPPAELQRLWPRALASEPVQRVVSRVHAPQRRVLRFYGVSESSLARALAEAGGEPDGVEVTICARDFELHVDLLAAPGAEERADLLERALVGQAEGFLFARDERPVEEHVLELCRARGWTLGTAESCTGGLVAARLTSVPGSSDVFLGAIVSYADEVKAERLGVPRATLAGQGAVSAETAEAMARGAREALGVDVAVAVTGIAGPGGATPGKPVGLVHLHAEAPGGGLALRLELPGDRQTVRSRATVAALHLLRRLLSQNRRT
ncbi:MAG TPA: nicotinamide-nucleotide amidohydrolase family protein [Gaiellaceae bacterium]|nr:nicotinamide-nucleotide amidohydrolase family protein [Gaiellaceae bacterium]